MTIASSRLWWCYLNGAGWWFGLLLTAAGGSLAGIALGTHPRPGDDQQFAEAGIRTEARVVSKAQLKEPVDAGAEPEWSTVYTILYQYQDSDGETFQGTARVNEATWYRYQVGDTLWVEYLAHQSDKSRADDRERPPLGWRVVMMMGAGGVVSVAGLAILATATLRARRRMRVVRDGVPCLGRVIDVLTETPGNHQGKPGRKRSNYFLAYSFTDQRGVLRDGQTAGLPRGFESRWHAGDPVLVLYKPPDIYRHEVDLFGARADELANMISFKPR
jgi:hypothetical protein